MWFPLLCASVSAQIFPTVGGYSSSPSNVIDYVAQGSIDLNQFRQSVADAYATDRGGVFQCELVGLDTGPYTFAYGASQDRTMQWLAGPNTHIGVSAASVAQAISGEGYWVGLQPQISFLFSSPQSSLAPVSAFGLTILSENTFAPGGLGTVTGTASFSGGGMANSSRVISEGSGLGDTFFGFSAPAGEWITSVSFSTSQQFNIPMDDIAFVTAVPEPGVTALVLLASGMCVLARRRKTASLARGTHDGAAVQRRRTAGERFAPFIPST
jgi:hypothetical protein